MGKLANITTMKNTPRALLTAAAIAGLLNGAVINSALADGTNAPAAKTAPGKSAVKEPKVHGCSGMNDCKGLGGCKSGDNGCKFKNSCKGKGGCEITKKDIQLWKKKQKEAAAKVKT